MEIWKKEKASIKWDDEEEKKEFEDLLKELCENKSRKLKFTITLKGVGCKYIAEALKTNTTLQSLDLAGNEIGNEGCRHLSKGLARNNSLEELFLYNNEIKNEGCKDLSEALKMNHSLKFLYLYGNYIGNEGCKYLSEALKVNSTLEELFLYRNSIENEGCKYFLEALKFNNTLQRLNFENNDNLETSIIREIIVKLDTNKELNKEEHKVRLKREKSIKWEEITKKYLTLKILILEECQVQIKTELHKFKALEILDLSNNELDQKSVSALCDFIIWNSTLRILNLQGNKTIGDSEGDKFLSAVSFNISLTELNLVGTSVSPQIQGKIKNKLKQSYALTQFTGKFSLNKVCSKYHDFAESVILNKDQEASEKLSKKLSLQFLQEVLFICCVWDKIELCKYILNRSIIDVNFKLEDGNTYLHFSVIKLNYEISKLLIQYGIDTTLVNHENKLAKHLCESNAKHSALFEDVKHLKVVFVGKSGVGKTSLVKRLLNPKENITQKFTDKFLNTKTIKKEKDNRTDGIETREWKTGTNHNVQLWDFGGSEIFYSTHQLFLSKNSLYLLLFDLTDKFMEKELFFWLNSIQYKAPGSNVIIVGTHMDKIDSKLMEEEIIMSSRKIKTIFDKVVSSLSEKSIHNNESDDNRIKLVPCSYWENPPDKEIYWREENIWFYPINAKEGWNIRSLEITIRKFSDNNVPGKDFLDVKDELVKSRDEIISSGKLPVLLREELGLFILGSFDSKHDAIERNIKLLHDLGYILDFGMKYVFLLPKWLSILFKSVICLHPKNPIKNGEIHLSDIFQNLEYQLQSQSLLEKKKPSVHSFYDISNAMTTISDGPQPRNSSNEKSYYETEYKSQNDFLLDLLEEFNFLIPQPNQLASLKELYLSSQREKHLHANITMIVPCLIDAPKPNDIEGSIFNLRTSSYTNFNTGVQEIIGRKYYFPFIPKGIYENLITKLFRTFGYALKVWKNGFLIASKDSNTNLVFEIIENETNMLFTRSIGPLSSQAISSFHFIIEDLLKTDYSLLWRNLNLKIYYKKLNSFRTIREQELTVDYQECLEKIESNEELTFGDGQRAVSFEKLIPEKFEDKNNNVSKVNASQIILLRKFNFSLYADTFICCNLETNGRYIVKKFKFNYASLSMNAEIQKAFEAELKIMKDLNHPNLASLLSYEQSNDNLALFGPACNYSLKSLQEEWLNRLPSELLKITRDPLSEGVKNLENWWKDEEILFISLQISNGLEYLHNNLISHLCLNSEHIFISLNGNFEYGKSPSLLSIYIGDFGEAMKFENLNSTFSKYVGSRPYMAPEVKKNENKKVPYNPFKADIYSLGVLFCELVGNDTSIKYNLEELKGKTKLEKIIANCLQEDPTQRDDIGIIKTKLQRLESKKN